MNGHGEQTRKFTGWHMTAILIGFFAIVIAVNIFMATVAVGSFGGTVVDNSYVASQEYNGWLKKAREQKSLGWKNDMGIDTVRHVTLSLHMTDGTAVSGAQVQAVAEHPLGLADDIALTFHETAPGEYASRQTLPTGRWKLGWKVGHAGQHAMYRSEVN
mgnify:CR=1 FL=1